MGTVGLDWSPAVLYYAHRRGNMVTAHARDADLTRSTTTATGTCSSPSHFAGTWDSWKPWRSIRALGPHLYLLADVGARLPAADLLATDPGPSLAGRLRPRVLRCRCAGGAEMLGGDTHSRGTGGDVAALRGGLPRGRRGHAPVPARRAVFASPALARNGTLVVSCAGRDELSLVGVLDAPAPR